MIKINEFVLNTDIDHGLEERISKIPSVKVGRELSVVIHTYYEKYGTVPDSVFDKIANKVYKKHGLVFGK